MDNRQHHDKLSIQSVVVELPPANKETARTVQPPKNFPAELATRLILYQFQPLYRLPN